MHSRGKLSAHELKKNVIMVDELVLSQQNHHKSIAQYTK